MGIWRNPPSAAVTVAAILASVTPSVVGADNFHPGRVVERGSNSPVSADVKAWAPSSQTNSGTDCPEFGDTPIDARISEASSGEFGLKVSADHNSYHVVYCANGYHRRVDRHLPNGEDGSPVVPIPAQLRRQSGEAAVQNDAVRLAVFALNELTYLYEITPEAVGTALGEYSTVITEQDESAGEVLDVLLQMIVQWSPSNQ